MPSPIDNNYYKIRGTELGEIKVMIQTVIDGDMPSQEEAMDVMSYVDQAFQQPIDEGSDT